MFIWRTWRHCRNVRCVQLLISHVAPWHSPSRPVIRQSFPHKSTKGQHGGKVFSWGSNGNVFHGDQENGIPHKEKGNKWQWRSAKRGSLCLGLWRSLWFRQMFCTKVATVQWLFSISSNGRSWLVSILFTSTLASKSKFLFESHCIRNKTSNQVTSINKWKLTFSPNYFSLFSLFLFIGFKNKWINQLKLKKIIKLGVLSTVYQNHRQWCEYLYSSGILKLWLSTNHLFIFWTHFFCIPIYVISFLSVCDYFGSVSRLLFFVWKHNILLCWLVFVVSYQRAPSQSKPNKASKPVPRQNQSFVYRRCTKGFLL